MCVFLTKQNSPEDCECIENVISGNPDFIYMEGFLEEELALKLDITLGTSREGAKPCSPPVIRPQHVNGAGMGRAQGAPGGSACPPPPPQVPTCAAEGHGADSGQVDGVSLFP